LTSLLKIKFWALFTIMRVLIQTSVVMVVLSDLFRGMGARKNTTETQQSSHTPWSGLEVKIGRSDTKYGAPRGSNAGQSRERGLRSCRWCPQEEFFSDLSCINKKTGPWQRGRDSSQRARRERLVPPRKPKESGKKESYEKDFVFRSYSRYSLSLRGEGEYCSGFG